VGRGKNHRQNQWIHCPKPPPPQQKIPHLPTAHLSNLKAASSSQRLCHQLAKRANHVHEHPWDVLDARAALKCVDNHTVNPAVSNDYMPTTFVMANPQTHGTPIPLEFNNCLRGYNSNETKTTREQRLDVSTPTTPTATHQPSPQTHTQLHSHTHTTSAPHFTPTPHSHPPPARRRPDQGGAEHGGPPCSPTQP
jgi:hypothetical protein